jgi:hypothetical protein
VKRHLERSIPGTNVVILNRNNIADASSRLRPFLRIRRSFRAFAMPSPILSRGTAVTCGAAVFPREEPSRVPGLRWLRGCVDVHASARRWRGDRSVLIAHDAFCLTSRDSVRP